jgi:threonine/homoserine/homoserine lactone efflux protein
VDPSLAAYVTLTALLVVTPGASTAVVIRHVLNGGRPSGVGAAAGIALANSTWAAAAGLGFTAVLARLPMVFSIIRLAGAAYLAFLAVGALARAWAPRPDPMIEPSGAPDPARAGSAFRDGLAVNMLNPPLATFYLVVVPSFLSEPPSAGGFVLLAAIHVLMALGWQLALVIGFARLRHAWARPTARRTIDAITGAALLSLAITMLR